MNKNKEEIIYRICEFLSEYFQIDATENTALLGADAILDSLSVLELAAWCEDTFQVENLLEDDLTLECLSSVKTLAEEIISKGQEHKNDYLF